MEEMEEMVPMGDERDVELGRGRGGGRELEDSGSSGEQAVEGEEGRRPGASTDNNGSSPLFLHVSRSPKDATIANVHQVGGKTVDEEHEVLDFDSDREKRQELKRTSQIRPPVVEVGGGKIDLGTHFSDFARATGDDLVTKPATVCVKKLTFSAQLRERKGDFVDVPEFVETTFLHKLRWVWEAVCLRRKPPTLPTVEKTILKNISFFVKPKRMVLVLGAPGSGKSTLLQILAGRVSNGNLQGTLSFNGQLPHPKLIHRQVSFVGQEDVHLAPLTVKQTLSFAAGMQEPEHIRNQRGIRMDVLLQVMGLKHREDTLVGNGLLRGVSGGEKKRVTIGCELTKAPALVLLDEPTTGLDAAAAFDVFVAARTVCDNIGKPFIAILKQPSVEIFELFDYLLLLDKGEVAYFGPIQTALPYFASLGYPCPPRENPADFLQEVVANPSKFDHSPSPSPSSPSSSEPIEFMEMIHEKGRTRTFLSLPATKGEPKGDKPRTHDEFIQAYKDSAFYQTTQQVLMNQQAPSDDEASLLMSKENRNRRKKEKVDRVTGEKFPRKYPISGWTQFVLCVIRGFQLLRNFPVPSVVRILRTLLIATIVGTTFLNLENDQDSIRYRQGLLFNNLGFVTWGAFIAMTSIFEERPVFLLQRANRYYSVLPYFVAGIIVELPVGILEVVIFGSLTYWPPGLNDGDYGRRFIFCLLVLFATALAYNSFCKAIAAVSPNTVIANILVPGLFFITVIMSGYIVIPSNIPDFMIWLYWSSPGSYGYEALIINEFAGQDYRCKKGQLLPPKKDPLLNEPYKVGGFNGVQICRFLEGEQVLDASDLNTNGLYMKWAYLAALLGFSFLFQVLAYFAMRFTSHRRRYTAIKTLKDQEPEPKEELVKKNEEGSYISFKDLNYSVPAPKGSGEIPLLINVTGYVKPGMLLALMGSSGAGKSTLLDVLANRKTGGKISGDLLINGKPRTDTFHRLIGYVEQQDIHFPMQTVKESLQFSALLRLPSTISKEEKLREAARIESLLNLRPIANKLVEHLSMEERKRLTIGVELAANPSILFLDEPTSGLDSAAADSVMRVVQKIAESGKAVICTIHQPSSTVFSYFTDLLLMRKGGRVVYFGNTGKEFSKMLGYFEETGSPRCLPGKNPADYILEVTGAGIGKASADRNPADVWEASRQYQALLKEFELGVMPAGARTPQFSEVNAESIFVQCREVFTRAARVQWRSPEVLTGRFIRGFAIGLFLGLLFIDLDRNQEGANAIGGLLFSCILYSCLGSIAAIPPIIEERLPYYKEQAAGAYQTICYLFSFILVDIPAQVIASACFVIPVYWISGLNTNPGKFFFFWANYLGVSLAGTSLAQAVAALSPNIGLANAVVGTFISLFSTFAGFLITQSAIPSYWIWLYWGSFIRYPLESMLVNEVEGQKFSCDRDELVYIPVDVKKGLTQPYCPITSGDQIIDKFDMDPDWKWIDLGIIWGIWLVFCMSTLLIIKKVKHINR